jgi:hypothetical protein
VSPLNVQYLYVVDTAFQIFAGSALGFIIAAAIGATFIAIWFTKASDLWKKSEEIWEGRLLVEMASPHFDERGL